MYIFEFNDNLRYRTRTQLADELREIADRIESGCSNLPSSIYNAPAGWLHKDFYDSGSTDDDEEDYEEEDYDYEGDEYE